jgi:hypothetical protein
MRFQFNHAGTTAKVLKHVSEQIVNKPLVYHGRLIGEVTKAEVEDEAVVIQAKIGDFEFEAKL